MIRLLTPRVGLIPLLLASVVLSNCVVIPAIPDGGTVDVIDGSLGDQGVVNPNPDGARDVPTNTTMDGEGRDGSVDPDASMDGNGDGSMSMDGNGGSLDGNGGCFGSGAMMCGAVCVNSQVSTMHCGACGNACPAGINCVNGECNCAAGTVACGGSCVNTQTNITNCGRCGNMCPAGINCVGGVCMCPAGTTACGGTCVSTQSNTMHCGMCNNVCAMGQSCTGGSCQCPMAAPQTCAGACVNVTSDNNNCGACGTICGANRVCTAGACACSGALMACGAACVDLATSAANCGACGRACGATQACVASVCACPMGQRECVPGVCTNVGNNVNNCGRCGVVCPALPGSVATCTGGGCETACAPGFADCDGNAMNGCEADLNNSANNCGACGTRCTAGACVMGGCSEWARQIGRPVEQSIEAGNDVAEDPMGNVYVVGNGFGTLNFGSGPIPLLAHAGYLASYTPRGALRWFRIIDANNNDTAERVTVRMTPGGIRVAISGVMSGMVNFGAGNVGGFLHAYVAEYDGAGMLQWTNTFSRPGFNPPRIGDIAMGPAGEVYLASSTAGFTCGLTDVPNPTPGVIESAALLKFNAMGRYQWTRWPLSERDQSSDGTVVAVDSAGNVIFGGWAHSIVDLGGGPRGTAGRLYDVMLAKYDANNMHIWSDVFGLNGNHDTVTGIAINPFSDDVTISGHFFSQINFGAVVLTALGPDSETFLARFRAAGAMGRADHATSRSIINGDFRRDDAPRLTYTDDARLFIYDTTRNIGSYAGFAIPRLPLGRKSVLAELNPASLAVLNVLTLDTTQDNGANLSTGVSGCGTGYVCLTGFFIPSVVIGNTTFTNSGAFNDLEGFIARIARP